MINLVLANWWIINSHPWDVNKEISVQNKIIMKKKIDIICQWAQLGSNSLDGRNILSIKKKKEKQKILHNCQLKWLL